MDWNHMGSYSSPIVISDDEDDAYVELQLEDRLSDAVFDDGFDDVPYYEEENLEPIMNIRDYELGDYYEDEERYQIYSAPLKRKRSESFEPEPPVILNANLLPPPPPAESKRARKKRLRIEGVLPPVQGKKSKKAKTQQTQAHQPSRPKFVQGSSAPVPEYMPLPPKPLPMGSHYSQLDLPPLPASIPLSFPPPFPPPMAFPPYNSIMDFSMPLSHLPPHPPMHLPPLPVSAHLPPRPPSPPPPLPPPAPVPPHQPTNIPSKRIIGMPYPDPDNKGAALASFTKLISPLPDPSRTLVMVMLPKKFRTRNFALQWALSFDKLAGPRQHLRIEVDVKAGKTLVEFRTPQVAQAAWGSPRLPLGDGREHVRVWWYHEIEEGEIGEEGEIVAPPPPVPRKDKVKPKTTLPGGQSSWQATPAKSHASLSSTNSKIAHGVHLMPLPPTTPTPFILPPRPDPSLRIDTATTSINPPLPSVTSITFSVMGEESMDLGSDDGLDDSYDAPSILPPHSSITNVADISSATLTCDTSNVSQTSSSSTAVSSPILTSVVKTLPSELPEQKTAQAPVGQKEALLAKQRMSEEDIAQTKKAIAGKQAVDFSEPSPPKVVKDTQTTESALRQRIVDSMRNRQASNTLPRNPSLPPKPVASVTSTVAKTSSNLDALAVSFISETIQTATVTLPTKKPSPPPSVRPSIAAREKELRRLIAESGSLMEQYKVATTKPEKDAIMNEIRKCTRAYDAMKNVSIFSPVLKPARPAPWPKTSEDSYILIISDTEDEDEDDEYDDMTL